MSPLVLLKTHSHSGVVHCCLQVQSSIPCLDNDKQEQSKVILCEIVDLELPQADSQNDKKIYITYFPLYNTLLFHHWAGVHKMNSEISTFIEKGERAIKSEVELIVDGG